MPSYLRIVSSRLLNIDEGFVLHHALTYFYDDGTDLARFLCLQGVGHLHGFEHDDSVASSDFLSFCNADLRDNTRQRSLNGGA